ncbi:MAG: DUF1707 domain-containing protein [Streptosporangiales bacterium]|nr:DUF1707 domain-containing protein [Streptosporangiales bacterium]
MVVCVELVPRVQPRDLRASDADRERTVDVLREAVADGRLTLDEHGERVDRAYASRTLGELAELTTDLVEASAQPVRFESKPLFAVFGSEEVSGRWVVPGRLVATAIFGEVKLDLREALLQQRTVTVQATALFGSVKVIVPDGIEVRMSGPAILGGKSSRVRVPDPPGGPVVDVRSFVLCGEIKAIGPRRGWFGRLIRS